MDQNKRDQQHDKRDQRRMGHEPHRDAGSQRNEEETGQPVQLDEDGKEHQGNQPRTTQTEHKPDQGQRTGPR